MILLPIDIDNSKNNIYRDQPDCIPVLDMTVAYYDKIGYNIPYIGYFASLDGKETVGAAGFKGEPKNGRVEIAYGTFPHYEGKGIGTQICRQLVLTALEKDPSIKIAARTLKDGHASIAILKKNNFECVGIVIDEDDGEVLEWVYKP